MKKILLSLLVANIALIATSAQEINIYPAKIHEGSRVINPVVVDSTLYFASDMRSSTLVTFVDQNDDNLFRIYSVPIVNRKPKGTPRLLLDNSNKKTNQFSIAFDKKRQMYVTQNNAELLNARDNPVLSIMKYSDRKSFEGSNTFKQAGRFNMAYPAISQDGKLMIFASDKKGGSGQSDLYMCEWKNGEWTEPVNLGPNVNSPGMETTPFIHPSGKIFFASNGRDDSRRLDIYYTFRTDEGFTKPVRMDISVNSIADDYGFFYSDNEEWGYLTSNRQGNDKLYYFTQIFPEFPNDEEIVEENYCYTFYEESTQNYDENEFAFRWSFSDGTQAAGAEVDHCFNGPGEYDVQLNVIDKITNEEMFSIADYHVNLERPVQLLIDHPDVIHANQKVSFLVDESLITTFTPSAFYWDFGNGTKVKGRNATVVFQKPGRYKVKCGTIADEDSSVTLCNYVYIDVVQ